MKVPSIVKLVFNRIFFQKIFAIVLLIIIAYTLKWFVFLFLATFLFAYLFLNLGTYLSEILNDFVVEKIKKVKLKKFLKFAFSINAIVLYLYIFFVGILIFAISDILPKVIQELTGLTKSIPFLSSQVSDILKKLEEIKNFNQDIKWTFDTVLTEQNYDILLKFIEKGKTVWIFILELVVSLILSYVFIIDRKKIKIYLEDIKKWNFAFLYNEYEIYFTKISNWFGLIFKAQSLISFINTFLTIIWLYTIALYNWYSTFPYIFTLAIITFIFGIIPVLWMFLSSVPIMMIGFAFWAEFNWSISVIIEILIMIIAIHAIEAYYLNPRIVSSYAELPMSLTFLILVISEQFFGFAWLLIWVPIFYILIDILKDFDIYIGKVKKANIWINFLQKETQKAISSNIRLSRSGKKSINT